MLVHFLSEVCVHGWPHFHFTSQFSRYKISPSAMTVAGLWSARCGALPMSSPSIRTADSPASEHTCPPAWWTAWADSRRAQGWKRSSKSWHLNKEDAVALFQACQAVLLAHHSMVNPFFLFHLPLHCQENLPSVSLMPVSSKTFQFPLPDTQGFSS